MLFRFIGSELDLVIDLTRKAFGLGIVFDNLYYLDRFSFLTTNYSNSESYRCFNVSIKELDASRTFEAKQGFYKLFNGINLVFMSDKLAKVVVLESDTDNISINRISFPHSNYGVKIVIPPSVKSIELDGYTCKDGLNLYVKRDRLRDLFIDYYFFVKSRDTYRFNSEYYAQLFRFNKQEFSDTYRFNSEYYAQLFRFNKQEFSDKSDEEIVEELNKVFNISLVLY